MREAYSLVVWGRRWSRAFGGQKSVNTIQQCCCVSAWASFNKMMSCRRGAAALEFALVSIPLITLLFSFIATSCIFYTMAAMQATAQYSARMVSTGQIKNFSNGAITTQNTTATTTCSGSLTTAQAEYYACAGLPSWATFTVTATENCAVPSVTVGISVNAQTAAMADIFGYFTGKTLLAQAVIMKEGQCP